jgi:hypothetical protein
MSKRWWAVAVLLAVSAAPASAQGLRPRSGVDNLGNGGASNLGTGGASRLGTSGVENLSGAENLPCTGNACGSEGLASPSSEPVILAPPMPSAPTDVPAPPPPPRILTPADALIRER